MKFALTRKKTKDVYYMYITTSYRDVVTGTPAKVYWQKFGPEQQLLEADPQALEKIQSQVDELNARKEEKEIQEKLHRIVEAKSRTLEIIKNEVKDYHQFVEGYLHKLYQIGGEVILPSAVGGINQTRGFRSEIRDRWDLTLECIRRYYKGEDSPLKEVLDKNKAFFDLFVDFKGYVDYFFFQDLVDDQYSKVLLWLDTPLFIKNPIPKTKEQYFDFINREIDFVERRNKRIEKYIANT